MTAERWMRELEMLDKVRQHILAKEKAQAAEEERTRQEAERRAWLRELCSTGEASRPAGRVDENGA